MRGIFAPIIANLESIIEHGGYAILSLITILEGVPIVGSLIPGHTVVIISGFLSKIEIFQLNIVILVVILSAMIGDFSGFYLGKRYGYSFLNKFGKTLFIKDEYIEKAKQIVANHTGKAIILGRFNPITRPLVPFIVGASKVHINKFWLFDFIGVSLWALVSIMSGYIFGASYHLVSGVIGKFIFIAIIISVLIIWGYSLINKRFHIFAKYELIALILNLVGLYGFFKTIQDAIKDHAFMAELDIWINTFFVSHANESVLTFMNFVTNVFSPVSLLIIALVISIYLYYKRKWRYLLITLSSMIGGFVLGGFIKEIIERTRPLDSFILEFDYSFPSVHALVATVFFTLIIYIFISKIRSLVIRELLIVVSVIIVLLVSFSRVYLGVHWFSDIIAGCSFGLFWITLMILSVRYFGLIYTSIRDNWYKKTI